MRQHRLGRCYAAETGFFIARDPDTVLAPDFAFIATDRLTFSRGPGYVPLVPDLVLETRSPSDRPADVAEKVRRWLDAGVRMVLELNPPARELTVYRPGTGTVTLGVNDTLTGGDLLPGLSLPLDRLFL